MKPSAREGRAQGVGAGDCEPSHRRVEKIIDSGGNVYVTWPKSVARFCGLVRPESAFGGKAENIYS